MRRGKSQKPRVTLRVQDPEGNAGDPRHLIGTAILHEATPAELVALVIYFLGESVEILEVMLQGLGA